MYYIVLQCIYRHINSFECDLFWNIDDLLFTPPDRVAMCWRGDRIPSIADFNRRIQLFPWWPNGKLHCKNAPNWTQLSISDSSVNVSLCPSGNSFDICRWLLPKRHEPLKADDSVRLPFIELSSATGNLPPKPHNDPLSIGLQPCIADSSLIDYFL